MKWIQPIAFLVLIIAAGVSVVFVRTLRPTSASAFVFFAFWLVLPHVIMTAGLIVQWKIRTKLIHYHIVAVLVSIGGIIFLTDVIFWRPDAQGAIAVLMTPVIQVITSALLLPVAYWVSRKALA